jgi:hypothetical protein
VLAKGHRHRRRHRLVDPVDDHDPVGEARPQTQQGRSVLGDVHLREGLVGRLPGPVVRGLQLDRERVAKDPDAHRLPVVEGEPSLDHEERSPATS